MIVHVDPTEIVGLLTLGIHDAGIYFAEHARVQATSATLAGRLDAVFMGVDDASLFLGVVDRRLVHNGKFLLGPTLIAKRLIEASERFDSGGFLFRRGVTSHELVAFFAVCSGIRAKCASIDDARQLLRSRGVFSIELSPPFGSAGWLGGLDEPSAARVAAEVVRSLGGAIPAYQRLREAVETAHAAAEHGKDIDVSDSRGAVESLLAEMETNAADVLHLARYPDHANHTIGHSVRVALLVLMAGRHLGFPPRALVEIGTAGLLHDVGKARVPREVLFKKGKLDPEERRLVESHAVLGARILLGTPDSPPLGVAAAFGHHMRHDRNGYPAIPQWGAQGRITALMQVCDVFEAMTAVRPNRASLSPRRAYELMMADRGAFDRSAFAAFVGAIGFFPPGSRVKLVSGEEAFVLRAGRDPEKPVVEVMRTTEGAVVPLKDRRAIDLENPDEAGALKIDDVLVDDLAPGNGSVEEHGDEHAEGAQECCDPAATATPESA